MAETIARDVELNALRDEVHRLRRLVTEMDSDMAELEWHIEFMDRCQGTHLYVLGTLLSHLFGPGKDADPDSDHGDAWRRLYPVEAPDGQRRGASDGWKIPRRRWRQYGGREELAAAATEHGMDVGPRVGREWMVRWLARAGVRPSLRSEAGR